MCDTFVVTSSGSGPAILAKNSDREPNEAQAIERIPARDYDPKTAGRLKTTYIEIDQVEHTHEILISRPFHMWGAEMGVNEHGLAIGNEAVFTKLPFARKDDGLTGMDLLRLALERSADAESAVALMTELLEKHGQDACGGYQDRKFYYHNSFIIADPGQAYVLETVDRFWAAKKVQGYASISNGLTIGQDFDLSSTDLADEARKAGLLKPGRSMDFQKVFSDSFYTRMSGCRYRQSSSYAQAGARADTMTPRDAMRILRSHGDYDGKKGFHPSKTGMKSLCLHASGMTAPSQTTGSMVVQLDKRPVVWFTGTAAPCISIFKPFFFGHSNLQSPDWVLPGAIPDDSLWWMHERMHRGILNDFMKHAPDIQARRDALEYEFISRLPDADQPAADVEQYSNRCLNRGRDMLLQQMERLKIDTTSRKKLFRGSLARPFYTMFWKGFDGKLPGR
tara:strand:- start:187777 stop:189126 length:1350 start_codon:yes stop_codon:yes gene_type:complete